MWERIDTTNKLRNVGGNDPNLFIEKRVYGKDGNVWPRLTLSISKQSFEDGFRIAANLKRDTNSWWETVAIPFELQSEILDMVSKIGDEATDDIPDPPPPPSKRTGSAPIL